MSETYPSSESVSTAATTCPSGSKSTIACTETPAKPRASGTENAGSPLPQSSSSDSNTESPSPSGFFTTRARRPRPSRLDHCDPASDISRSQFMGLINMALISGGLWLVFNPLYNRYERGYWFDLQLAQDAFGEVTLLMAIWALILGWSYTAYGVYSLRSKAGLSRTLCRGFGFTSLFIPLVGMLLLIQKKQLAVFPKVFLLTITMIHLMKMHSFLSSVLDLEKWTKNNPNALSMREHFQGITIGNFTTYLFIPCLVYEVNYPRCPHPFRPSYFARKLWDLISVLAGIYLVAQNFIIPAVNDARNVPRVHTFARIVLPLLAMDLLFFYLMFECVLNLLGEVTDYGDREFYEDWWNCTTWEEFARKWNKPVHEYLLRHVYYRIYNISRRVDCRSGRRAKLFASLITFLFSAVLHEIFLSATLGFVRFWMSGLMMCQIPLIMLGRYHKGTSFGNYYFWFGICMGVPFLFLLYGHEWSLRQTSTLKN